MPGLSIEAFADWLEAYGRASKEDDAAASAALFSDEAEYYESPFNEAIAGRTSIRKYWEQGAERFTDKDSRFEILAVRGNRGIARWQAQFTDRESGQRTALDCVFVADFDETGHCRLFREWWHSSNISPVNRQGPAKS